MAIKRLVGSLSFLRRFVIATTVLHICGLSYLLYLYSNLEIQGPTISFLQLEDIQLNKNQNHSQSNNNQSDDPLRQRYYEQGSIGFIPCRWDGDCKPVPTWFQRMRGIRPPQSQLIVRNSFRHDRYWCDKLIPALQTIEIDAINASSCNHPPQLFRTTPTVSAEGMPAIEAVYYDFGMNDTWDLPTEPFDCNVPCRIGGQAWSVVNTVSIHGTPWKFIKSTPGGGSAL